MWSASVTFGAVLALLIAVAAPFSHAFMGEMTFDVQCEASALGTAAAERMFVVSEEAGFIYLIASKEERALLTEEGFSCDVLGRHQVRCEVQS